MNGLAQCGISVDSLVTANVIDTNTQNPAPEIINEEKLRDQLIN